MLNKLIFALAICIPSNLLADFRSGWGHSFGCEHSSDPDCVPHCHDVDDEVLSQEVEEHVQRLTKDLADLFESPRNSESFSKDYLALIEIHTDFFKKYRKSAMALFRRDTSRKILTIFDESECAQMKSNPDWPPHPYEFLFKGVGTKKYRI